MEINEGTRGTIFGTTGVSINEHPNEFVITAGNGSLPWQYEHVTALCNHIRWKK